MDAIYFDHNATTPPTPEVVAAVSDTLSHCWGNASSAHGSGAAAKSRLVKARAQVAALLGAGPSEIVFTSGATESNHMAILGALAAQPGKTRIVSSAVEHPATLKLLEHLERLGYIVTCLDVDTQGRLDPARIAAALTPQTALLSLMWANNETGALFPVAAAAQIAKARGVLFHTDAVQAVGKVEIDVRQIPVGLLSVSAHKLHGPPGIGALFVRKGVALPPLIFGHQERRRRGGTENLPGIVGFGVAAEQTARSWREDAARVQKLRDYFELQLTQRLAEVRINAAGAERLPNTSNFAFGAIDAEIILDRLDKAGIRASSGSACTAGGTEASHVLTAMGQPPETALAALRFSFGSGNHAAEIQHVLDLLPAIVEPLMLEAVT
ncbi:MAG: aminotransferase class V-fold PLP-dependent enzyme [Proteobacteria bacterium]|nr:aminotransferase class V-fold PLP-dependent enzyme [Pseudomonadota bacterium]